MADPTVKVRITAEDRASPVIEQTRGAFSRLGSFLADRFVITLGDIVRAVRSVVDVFAEWIRAAEEQERATARLISSLAGVAGNVTDTTEALLRQAAALQQTTRFSDDAVISAQAILATYGVLPEQLEKATLASANLAAALGIDVADAARKVGGTTSGAIREVARLVPELRDLSAEALAAGEGINLLAEALAGRAAADAETFGGKLEIAKNALGELGEAIGTAVIQNESLGAALQSVARNADASQKTMAPLVVIVDGITTAVVRSVSAIASVIAKFTEWNLVLARWIDTARGFIGIQSDLEASILRQIGAAERQLAQQQGLSAALQGVAGAAQSSSNAQQTLASSTERATTVATEQAAVTEELVKSTRALESGNRSLAPTLDRVTSSYQRAATAAASYNAQVGASGVTARDPRNQGDVDRAVAAGMTPILGGTRIRLPRGGSRLLGRSF